MNPELVSRMVNANPFADLGFRMGFDTIPSGVSWSFMSPSLDTQLSVFAGPYDARSERMTYLIRPKTLLRSLSGEEVLNRLTPLFQLWEEGVDVAVRLFLSTNELLAEKATGVSKRWFSPTFAVATETLQPEQADAIHDMQRAIYNAILSRKRQDPLFSYEWKEVDRLSSFFFYSGGLKGTLSCTVKGGAWHLHTSRGFSRIVSTADDAKKQLNDLFDDINRSNRTRELLSPTWYYVDQFAFSPLFEGKEQKERLLALLLRRMEPEEVERAFCEKTVRMYDHVSLPVSVLSINGLHVLNRGPLYPLEMFDSDDALKDAYEEAARAAWEAVHLADLEHLARYTKGEIG